MVEQLLLVNNSFYLKEFRVLHNIIILLLLMSSDVSVDELVSMSTDSALSTSVPCGDIGRT